MRAAGTREAPLSLLGIPANLKRLSESPWKEGTHILRSENLARLMDAKGKGTNRRKSNCSQVDCPEWRGRGRGPEADC